MSTQISQLAIQANAGTSNMPTTPTPSPEQLEITVAGLSLKQWQMKPALQGLTNSYSIGGTTAPAYEFLFGASAANAAISNRPLDQPDQFSIGWTNYAEVYRDAMPDLPRWVSTLTSPDAANREFWPTIANYGFGYILLFLEQVTAAQASEFKTLFGAAWTSAVAQAQVAGRLYAIDLRIFEEFPPTVGSPPRFTPGTITLLIQDASSGALSPVTVRVSSQGKSVVYSASGLSTGAWLYALQAAKTSATVYGIWLGHVYHLHIVTAAMQMTFYNNIPPGHPIYQLLQPRSDYLIGFDGVLLTLWNIAPPTSFDSAAKFLQLADRFATGRNFFDDDPKVAIAAQALDVKKFTRSSDWDLYPVAQRLLQIWNIVERLTTVFVGATYASDAAVAADGALAAWMKASAAPSPSGGNLRGLPVMNTRTALKNVLTSLLYRVTAHGISRLNKSVNPVLTFMANYPPCLQSADIPAANAPLSPAALLKMLPWTNTMGAQLSFYYIFVFSPPYAPLIPLVGLAKDLPFPGGPQDSRNQAVVRFRNDMMNFIHDYEPRVPEQVEQWEANIET